MKVTKFHKARHMSWNDNENSMPTHAVLWARSQYNLTEKVTSHRQTYKPYSNKHLLNIVVLTSMTCAGSRHDQMKLSRCMGQKNLRKRTKVGSTIRIKNRSPHKGPPLCAGKGADAWLLPAALLVMRYLAPTREIGLSRHKAGMRNFHKCAAPNRQT